MLHVNVYELQSGFFPLLGHSCTLFKGLPFVCLAKCEVGNVIPKHTLKSLLLCPGNFLGPSTFKISESLSANPFGITDSKIIVGNERKTIDRLTVTDRQLDHFSLFSFGNKS